MPAPKPPPDHLLAKAADRRAGGASWDAVAAQVGRAADTVRKWPAAYPAAWKKLLRAAERQLVRDATAESVHTLRRQLRSDDEKTSREAAQKLIQFRVALGRRGKRAKAAPTKPPSELMRTAAYLETLSDDQLTRLFDQIVARWVEDRAAGHLAEPPPGA